MIRLMQCESHNSNYVKCRMSCIRFFSVASKAPYFFLFVIDRPSVIKHSWASSLCWWHGTLFLLLKPNWHREHINYENFLAIANSMLICNDFWLGELQSNTDWFMFWTMMIKVLEFSNIQAVVLLYVSEQVKHVTSKVRHLRLLHRINGLSSHNPRILFK